MYEPISEKTNQSYQKPQDRHGWEDRVGITVSSNRWGTRVKEGSPARVTAWSQWHCCFSPGFLLWPTSTHQWTPAGHLERASSPSLTSLWSGLCCPHFLIHNSAPSSWLLQSWVKPPIHSRCFTSPAASPQRQHRGWYKGGCITGPAIPGVDFYMYIPPIRVPEFISQRPGHYFRISFYFPLSLKSEGGVLLEKQWGIIGRHFYKINMMVWKY